MRIGPIRKLALPLAAAALVGGCIGDGDEIVQVGAPDRGGELFSRYVALGNSITAGYQSGGINDSTQLQAYPVLLAEKAGAYFNVPLLNAPGCPPPFTAPLGPTRVGGGGPTTCALRANPAPFGPIQNLAVPGATIGSSFDNTLNPNALTTLVLGGRTQVQAMIAAQPSLVSAWLGNNDALGAALSGEPLALTSTADFDERLDSLVAGIRTAAPQDAILIGIVDPVVAVPLLQPGAYFFLARDAGGSFNGKPVNPNCSPVTALGQPNPLAANLVNFQIVADANFPEINCDPAAYPVGDPRRGIYLLDTAEQQTVRTRIAAFNAAISDAADANGWIYVDPNALLLPYIQQGPPFNQIRKCQMLATATTPAAFQTAVLQSCPVTGPTAAPNFFGALISFDGVHPSALAHEIVADAIAAELNQKHGLSLPTG